MNSQYTMQVLVFGIVGPSGIGKSSVAKAVAAAIGARYVELERVEHFTTVGSPSYATRDAVSETPKNIKWDVPWLCLLFSVHGCSLRQCELMRTPLI